MRFHHQALSRDRLSAANRAVSRLEREKETNTLQWGVTFFMITKPTPAHLTKKTILGGYRVLYNCLANDIEFLDDLSGKQKFHEPIFEIFDFVRINIGAITICADDNPDNPFVYFTNHTIHDAV